VNIKNSRIAIAGLIAVGAFVCALRAQETPAPARSVWDGVYTEEQAKRGEALYEKQCSTCHGDKLGGRESAPPLTGGAFFSNWNGLPLSDLFERVRKTMPQNAPGKLTRQQNADILAYMLSFNKFPAGKTELYRQAEMLKEIRFDWKKPDSKK
jgi:S-disulfanyl-L-cysteine oxidoreductase SoxD